MSDPKDRSGSKPGKTFGEAWESLPDGSPEASEGGTQAWTEEVRGARKHDADAKSADAEEPALPRTDRTMAWTEDVRGERKRDGKSAEPPAEDEMDRLMRAELTEAAPAEDPLPSASTSAMSFAAIDLPERKPDESMMDALMGAEPQDSSPSVDDAPPDEPEAADDGEGEQDDRTDEPEAGQELDDEPPPPIVLHPDRQRHEAQPVEPEPQKPKRSRLPLVVGGAVAAGLALWFSREPPTKPPAKDTRALGAPTRPVDPELAEPKSPTPPDRTANADPTEPDSEPSDPPDRLPPQVDPTRDPREPPEGTPPDIAAVFKKLPVSPADRAPVGGVGKTGIHVDDVSMGRGYERSRCVGSNGTFSVSKDDLANVCLRVVHQRQKEELSVVWQKVGGNARRGKIVVKSAHAYRTRAYLKLRSEYVGDWEVKIFSDDGVELARYPFTVVP